MIPLVDLRRQPEALKEELTAAIDQVIETSAFTLGETVERFETAFAAYCQTEFAVGVGSGTDALYLALVACGVTAGDEVITSPNTFIATAEAISMCGAKPVFVDVDPKTYNIDPSKIEAAVTPRTTAIIPVHLYGQPADMDPIMALARRHGLKVIEDACQAHGAVYRGRRVGSIGDAGCFSFYPSKNLGCLGDGGIVVTDDTVIAESIRLLRNHGESGKHRHLVPGRCSRLHGLQAAVLRVKLKYLDSWNQERREQADTYARLLEPYAPEAIPAPRGPGDHVYHLYVIRTAQREALRTRLAAADIGVGIHYPIPIHLQPAYQGLGNGTGDFPIAETLAQEILSLPLFPGLSENEISAVASAVLDGMGRQRKLGAEERLAV